MNKCDEIQTWFEQSLEENISPAKRMKMRFHLMMCKCCKGYTADSKVMHEKFKTLQVREGKLTKEELDRIKNNIL